MYIRDDVWGWFHEDLNHIKKTVEDYFNQKKINSHSDQDSTIVRCMECIQRPGDVVFVPSMWHHAVLNVRPRNFLF